MVTYFRKQILLLLWQAGYVDIAFLLIIILFIDNYTSIYMIELIAIFNLHEL